MDDISCKNSLNVKYTCVLVFQRQCETILCYQFVHVCSWSLFNTWCPSFLSSVNHHQKHVIANLSKNEITKISTV